MSMPASTEPHLSSVQVSLNFANPDAEVRLLDETDRSKSSARRFNPKAIAIHDGRPIQHNFSIDRNGFTVVKRATACRNFSDTDEVARLYLPEVERLIKELTGADRVFTFGPALRTDAPNRLDNVRPPATAPHVDYSEQQVRAFVAELAGEVEAQRLLARRFMLINVWRPLVTVERSPLALCDAGTIGRDDLVLAYVKGSVFAKPDQEVYTSEGYNVFYNPQQRWYYFPRLQTDEALVFKLCDSDHGAVQHTAHTAFEDPTSAPDAAFRQSYEIRTIAVMP